MIARIWHGMTEEEVGDAYARYIRETGIPMYRSQAGNRGVYLLKRIVDGKADFLLLSLWDSYESIAQFAGPDVEKARYFNGDKDYLIEMESMVSHYRVLEGADMSTLAAELLDLIIDVASGQPSLSEELDSGEEVFSPWLLGELV